MIGLAEDGWDVAGVYNPDYDDRMAWGRDEACQDTLAKALAGLGRAYLPIEADIADATAVKTVFDRTEAALGPLDGPDGGAIVVPRTHRSSPVSRRL